MGGCEGLGLGAAGEDTGAVEVGHVAVVGAVVDLGEAEGLGDLVGGLFEGPVAVEHAVGHLDHAGAVDSVVAVEVDGLVFGVCDDGGGFFDAVEEEGAIGVGAVIDDGDVDPGAAEFLGEGFFLGDEGVSGGVGEGDDGLDVFVADDAAHGPVLLPGASVDFAGHDGGEFLGEEIVVSVSPELLGGEECEGEDQCAAGPESRGAEGGAGRGGEVGFGVHARVPQREQRD